MSDLRTIPPENVVAAKDLCAPVCVTMAVGLNGQYGHHAMGLIFAVADSHFLVTCQHAVHDVVSRGAGLWIQDDVSKKGVALTPKFFFLKSPLYDLAIMKLPEEFIPYFSEYRFARGVETHSSDQPVGISCAMYGVLATESQTWDKSVSKDDKCLKTVVFIGRTTTVEQESEYIDDRLHFLIGADQLAAAVETDGGNKQRDPPESFRGLSGTPVFAVNDNPFEPNWTPRDAKIIGIQSSVITLHRQERIVMRVIRIELMYALIAEVFPSVSETIEKLSSVSTIQIRNRIVIP
jgi:hypothetical protein